MNERAEVPGTEHFAFKYACRIIEGAKILLEGKNFSNILDQHPEHPTTMLCNTLLV